MMMIMMMMMMMGLVADVMGQMQSKKGW